MWYNWIEKDSISVWRVDNMALINCPECSKEISNSAKKCVYCGYKIKKPKNRKKMIITLSCIIGGICIVIAGVLTFLYFHDNSLLNKAKHYYQSGQYSLAINDCNKSIIKTKETNQIISDSNIKLQEIRAKIKAENDAIDAVQSFKTYMDNLEADKTRDGITVELSDMISIVKDLKSQISTFEDISAPQGTDIYNYITDIKNSSKYQLMKAQINSGSFDDTSQNSLASAYGSIDTQLALTNAFIVSFARNAINDEVREIDSTTIPSKLSY